MMASYPSYVTPERLDAVIEAGLQEDIGPGDATTRATVPEHLRASGTITAKQPGTLAGTEVVDRIFARLDPDVRVDWSAEDGEPVREKAVVARISGPARAILSGERLALNVLQRMSGIATATAAIVRTIEGTGTTLLDTRKTAPGLRILDKWAVLLGGGRNHRVGLYDMILIKENHIAAAGGIRPALERATAQARTADPPLAVEIEVRSLDELDDVLHTGLAHRVMLDNFIGRRPDGSVDVDRLREAVRIAGGRLETEASGNVTLETARVIAETGVDFISCGALTHSVQALDLSLLLDLEA